LDDADLRELKAVFLLDAPGRLERIERHLNAADHAAAAAQAHSLCGAAATVGLETIAAEAERLETELRAGRMPNPERLADLVAEVEVQAAPAPPAPAVARGERTVLHVEDNPVNVKLIERALARRPHVQLLTATRADTGLRAAREARPDLIPLDLNLPDASGGDLLRRLRNDAVTRDVPVVLVTGHTATHADGLDGLGISEHLTKPIDVGRLLELVDEHAPPLT
jgi:CheY-like chemotaxis protein